jgi:hypothetical protein
MSRHSSSIVSPILHLGDMLDDWQTSFFKQNERGISALDLINRDDSHGDKDEAISTEDVTVANQGGNI